MDFLQSCFEFHRRYLSTGAGEMLEDAMLDLGYTGEDFELVGTVLWLFMHEQVRDAVESLQQHGVWTHYTGETVEPRPHAPASNARYLHHFV